MANDDNMNANGEDNIIELFDEDGNTISFEYIHAINYKEEDYIVLAPLDEITEEEANVVFLKVVVVEGGQERYDPVEDEGLQDELFEIFLREIEDVEEFLD